MAFLNHLLFPLNRRPRQIITFTISSSSSSYINSIINSCNSNNISPSLDSMWMEFNTTLLPSVTFPRRYARPGS